MLTCRFRSEKAESVQQQQQHQQHQQHQTQQRFQQQQPQSRAFLKSVTVSSPSVSPVSVSVSVIDRQAQQPQPLRHRQQHQRTYQDDEYEPASEIESDRQQRVYRGQPSTIGQVQRDLAGLRRNTNIISVSYFLTIF